MGVEVIVNRYGGGDGGHDKRCCHLSLVSLEDLSTKSLCENLNFPTDEPFDFNQCGEWLLLDDYEGNIALFNLKSKDFKLLPLPKLENPRETELGFDASEWYCDAPGEYTIHTDVYSLKSGYWREIPTTPNAFIHYPMGVYVGGLCYFMANYGKNVASFDSTNESFHCLDKPPQSEGLDLSFVLVECRGLLGAIGYDGKAFVVWVLEGGSWSKLFDMVLDGVERPVGFKDGQFLFLEGPRRDSEERSVLLVYDCIAKDQKKLGICGFTYCSKVISYVDDARPMPILEKRREELGED
ncbi:hypothetical protein OROMI_029283 [Orobanche minor]